MGKEVNSTKAASACLGIDLGTTNSAITITYPGWDTKVIECPNSKGVLVPSCVQYMSRDEVIVGESAYQNKGLPSVVYSTKVHMTEGDTYKIPVTAENGERFEVTPIEVATHVLKHMLDAAREYLGAEHVQKVTITVPAYFNDLARNNTKIAGVNAGLDPDDIQLINEPTSAALLHGVTENKQASLLVYDLGGGTFDVTVLKITPVPNAKLPTYTVHTNEGDAHLGGDDIDKNIYDKFIYDVSCRVLNVLREVKPDVKPFILQMDEYAMKTLLHKCERVKKMLQDVSVTIAVTADMLPEELQGVFSEAVEGDTLSITAPIYVSYVMEAVNYVFGKTEKIMQPIKGVSDKFDTIIMVGGSTKSELLRSRLRAAYPDKFVTAAPDPDLAVAMGASIYTYMTMEGLGSRLADTIPLPIGVKIYNQHQIAEMDVVIPKDSHLPVSNSVRLKTLAANQKGAAIEIYQGTRKFAEENLKLGEIYVDDLDVQGDKSASVEVNLTVNTDGILSADITIKDSSNVPKRIKKEISRVLNDQTVKSEVKVSTELNKNDERTKARQMRVIRRFAPEGEQAAAIQDLEAAWSKGEAEASKYMLAFQSKYMSTEFFA